MFKVAVEQEGFHIEVRGKISRKAFQELIQRGTNLWPDASPEIKEFADRVTLDWNDNKPLQNYRQQDTSPLKALTERRAFGCAHCKTDNLVDFIPGEGPITFSCWHCAARNQVIL